MLATIFKISVLDMVTYKNKILKLLQSFAKLFSQCNDVFKHSVPEHT